jgi:hypothetical protein
MVSSNQDPYELSTLKHWRIIHHLHSPNKKLSHELLSYKRNTEILKCLRLKHNGSETKILTLNDIKAHIGPMIRSPRLLLTGQTPKSHPSPRAHHWATQIYNISRNTQTSLHTIKLISKAWATKAQQDWPVNVAINSWLLACKVEIGGALYYVKPELRVSPYLSSFSSTQVISNTCFHEPAIFKSL